MKTKKEKVNERNIESENKEKKKKKQTFEKFKSNKTKQKTRINNFYLVHDCARGDDTQVSWVTETWTVLLG